MKKKLSNNEIKKIIDKLSEQYDKYSAEHGESFFSKKDFQDRYMEALKRGMGLQAFAFAEITFLEELKEKLAKQKEEQRIKTEKPFTKKVEKYIEELEKKWQKYPRLFSSTEISDEAQYFCGALKKFYNNYWLNIARVINKENISELKDYNSLTESIQKFVLSIENKFPYEVENYILNFNKYSIEKTNMLFLKEGANLLREIMHFLSKIQNKVDQNNEILFNTMEYMEQIIQDFRFTNLM